MVRGHGGLLGPDLSELGSKRTLPEIEQSLRNPGSAVAQGYGVVSARLRDGRILRGFARNESNYDLQLQSFDGKFYSLRQQEVVELTREKTSLMPEVKAAPEELRNLLSYLSRLSTVTNANASPRNNAAFPSISGSNGSDSGLTFTGISSPSVEDWPTYHGQL